MDSAIVASLVRHGLTTFGGVFLTRWGFGGGDVDAIAGAVGTLAGIVWAVWDKRKARESGL